MASPTEEKQHNSSVIYYTYDPDGRIRHTICLLEIKPEKPDEQVLYARGAVYLSNQDYAQDNFSMKAGIKVAKQRAEKVAEWYASGAWQRGYSAQTTFGKGRGKISADKMQLVEIKKLMPRDRLELFGLEAVIKQAMGTSKSAPNVPDHIDSNSRLKQSIQEAKERSGDVGPPGYTQNPDHGN